MAVSVFTLIALIISIIVVLVTPFSVIFLGRKLNDKRVSGFLSGFFGFFIAFAFLTLFWSLFGMENAIARYLGTDETVRMIRQTILYAVYAVVETVLFYFICRRYCKKGETTPLKALRFAGGYALPEALYVLLYLVLPLIVILSNGTVEFNLGETISLGSVEAAGVFEYLFKAVWRLFSFIVYAASLFLVYTGRRYDAKWFYFLAPILNLGLDLPYTYTAINSRKMTADTVVVINILWKSERFALILMTLTVIITLIICKIVYNNYYRPEEKRAAIKEKKAVKRQKRLEKKEARKNKKSDGGEREI